ncbi:RHS repeat-associated core domain-containing protein [Cysteiniphilum sp. 6C5]|uniref:RHS repeat-associated core domain-containing protein n=1 Tax=unclassified Cysteiniphilum TaxID=2610889 RepID=UPI003F82D985
MMCKKLLELSAYFFLIGMTQISFAQELLATGTNDIYYVNNGKSNSLTLDKPTNSNAVVAIQSTTDYQAYGVHSDTLNTNVATNFSYNGEYQDPSSDLVYLRARDYDAGTQRFITQDNANVWNKYNFADSNPIMNIDPSGHFSMSNVWHHATSGLFMTLIMSGVIFTGGYLGIAELAALGAESVATSEVAGVATEGLEAGATATAEATDVAEGSSAALTQSANDDVQASEAGVDAQAGDSQLNEGIYTRVTAEATNPNEAKFFSCVSRKTELRFGLLGEAASAVGVTGTYGSHFSPFLKKYESIWTVLDYVGGGAAFGLIKGLKFADYVENAAQTSNYLLRGANGLNQLMLSGVRCFSSRIAETNFMRSATAGFSYVIVKMPLLLGAYSATDAVYNATNHGEELPDGF